MMRLKEIIAHLRCSPMDGFYYVQGSVRLFAYRRRWLRWMIRQHIVEQFEHRRDVSARECYLLGSCKCCGCDTPALFFANKGCSVALLGHCMTAGYLICYPAMHPRRSWEKFKKWRSKLSTYKE